MKNILFTTVLLSSIILLVGCNDEDACQTDGVARDLVLSDSIKSFIRHYEDAERVIFKNENAEDVAFDLTEIDDKIDEYRFIGICDKDPSRSQLKVGTVQGVGLSLMNFDEIPRPIYISLLELPNPPENLDSRETLNVTLGELGVNEMQQEDFLLAIDFPPSQGQENLIFHDSLEIGNTTFYSVYEVDDALTSPSYEIKYSKNEGIIFIKDKITERELVYDRKE